MKDTIEALRREISWYKRLSHKYSIELKNHEPESYMHGFCAAKINSYDLFVMRIEKIIEGEL